MKNCEAKGCDVQLMWAKYCNKHSLRARRHGNPNYEGRAAKGQWTGMQCYAKDCARPVRCKGLCNMHYTKNMRLEKIGIPLYREAID